MQCNQHEILCLQYTYITIGFLKMKCWCQIFITLWNTWSRRRHRQWKPVCCILSCQQLSSQFVALPGKHAHLPKTSDDSDKTKPLLQRSQMLWTKDHEQMREREWCLKRLTLHTINMIKSRKISRTLFKLRREVKAVVQWVWCMNNEPMIPLKRGILLLVWLALYVNKNNMHMLFFSIAKHTLRVHYFPQSQMFP